MTETEWLEANNLQAMIDFLGDRMSHRKFRLFACACVRQVWALLTDERARQAVLVAERFADGLADKQELDAAAAGAKAAAEAQTATLAARPSRQGIANVAAVKAAQDAQVATVNAHWAASWTAVGAGKVAAWAAAKNSLRTGQPDLLREIVGNPFRPPAVPEQVPPVIALVARRVYDGGGSHYALHALLQKHGLPELAEHFREPSLVHPKGCWALDWLLRRV